LKNISKDIGQEKIVLIYFDMWNYCDQC